jgi:hypothetical protein
MATAQHNRQLRRIFAFLAIIVGISLIGLASHDAGDLH